MRPILGWLGISLALASCGEREEVTAGGKRELTMRDENMDLDASNDERFRSGRPQMPTPPAGQGGQGERPSLTAAAVPADWDEESSSSFRLLNYSFGTGGEAYVSLSRGGVLPNVNRWRQQFGAPALDADGLAELESAEVAGHRGVWVAAEGDFGGGMGAEAREDWALRGVVAEGPQGILTVKMLGPAKEVAAEEPDLRRFVAGLTFEN